VYKFKKLKEVARAQTGLLEFLAVVIVQADSVMIIMDELVQEVYRNFSFLKALNIKIIIDTNTSA
jgi:hypothetical protein